MTRDGRVKILDFGLAKLVSSDESSNAATQTVSGLVLGTIGYMAPEQVRGQRADQRADIFAFGVIVYEMLAGHRAFQGESPADTMSAILNQDPPELSDARVRLVSWTWRASSDAASRSPLSAAFSRRAISSLLSMRWRDHPTSLPSEGRVDAPPASERCGLSPGVQPLSVDCSCSLPRQSMRAAWAATPTEAESSRWPFFRSTICRRMRRRHTLLPV